jgi:hypothetical protein
MAREDENETAQWRWRKEKSEGTHVTPLILDAQYLKGLLLKVSRP